LNGAGLARKNSDLQPSTPATQENAKRRLPIFIWAIALLTGLACCVVTFQSGGRSLEHFVLLFIFANFQNIPGLVFTTLSTNRASAFRLWNTSTILVSLPGLALWASESFRPNLTEKVVGPMAGFSLLPFVLGFYILGAFGIFFFIAAVDLLNRKEDS
jgi:hypothetical protein